MERWKKFFSIFVITIVLIPFTFWGVYGYFDYNFQEGIIGKINGKKITLSDLKETQSEILSQVISNNQGKIPDELQDPKKLESLALAGLMDKLLFEFAADKFNMNITDEYLKESVEKIPNFQTDGKFDYAKFNSFIIESGLTIESFVNRYKNLIKKEQITKTLTKSELPNNWEIKHLIKLLNEKRNTTLYFISAKNLIADVEPSEKELQDYYLKYSEKFKTKESLDVKYVVLNKDELTKNVQMPSEEEIKEFYKINFANQELVQKRKAAHILLTLPKSEKNEEEVINKLQSIKKNTNSLAEFNKIAATISEDIATKNMGGDLGWLGKGDTDPDFEKSLFSLTLQNPISNVIKSQFGYHLIYLENIKNGQVAPLDEMRQQILLSLIDERKSNIYAEKLDLLQKMLQKTSQNLEIIASSFNGNLLKTNSMDYSKGDGHFTNNILRKQAFNLAKTNPQGMSEIVTLSDDSVMVYQINNYSPSYIPKLDMVKNEVIVAWKYEKATLAASKLADEKLSKINQPSVEIKIIENILSSNIIKIGDIAVYRLNPQLQLPDDFFNVLYQLNAKGDKSKYYKFALPQGDVLIYNYHDISLPSEQWVSDIFTIKNPKDYLEKLRNKKDPTKDETEIAFTLQSITVFENLIQSVGIDSLGNYLRDNAEVVLKPEYEKLLNTN
ncbi:MAG: SurA N-terminal domain-containing protein [Methylacidiphilales bacterium]|nr:SurA N-terminal domain-containing protein [Candidatus Methylacidiphilales bacterium]